MTTRMHQAVVTLALVLVAPTYAAATNCCRSGSPSGQCIASPLTHGQNGWLFPVCGAPPWYGNNCTLKLDADITVTSGDCVTLAKGATLDLNGRMMSCTGSSCGSAVVNVDSGGGSDAVEVTNGDITGPWATGVNVTGGTNSSVTEMLVDGAGVGINGVRGPIDHVVVRNASTGGVALYPGMDITNSILRNNGNTASQGYGLFLSGDNHAGHVDNVLFIGNYNNVFKTVGNSPTAQRSEFQDAVSCQCLSDLGAFGIRCYSPNAGCMSFTNSTTPSMIDDALVP